ncbi:hypothetical protein [Candidatus Tisiphia endosymbiont of Thecophora atra]|uniref:hypothetical protein n=1 Tax=Candidatus Tisiphia endosymbiont of Thecophora atra TaxID=3066258 RepID=UPI00312C744F
MLKIYITLKFKRILCLKRIKKDEDHVLLVTKSGKAIRVFKSRTSDKESKDNQPDSVLQGCLNTAQELVTNPGAAASTVAVGGAAVYAGLKQGNPALAEALGAEAALACLTGAVNTAVDNYQATCTNSSTVETTGVVDHYNWHDDMQKNYSGY